MRIVKAIKRIKEQKNNRTLVTVVLIFILGQLTLQVAADWKHGEISWREEICRVSTRKSMELFEPGLLFMEGEKVQYVWQEINPLICYIQQNAESNAYGIEEVEVAPIYLDHGEKEESEQSQQGNESLVEEAGEEIDEIQETYIEQAELTVGAEEENRRKQEEITKTIETDYFDGFVPATKKTAQYTIEQLSDTEFIREAFYTVDPTTKIRSEQLAYDKLTGFDATIKQDNQAPQILIYHTHSQECYVDSNLQDASTTIMGVGEYLSALLQKEYGFQVIHHLGMYDVEGRDYAYANAAKGIEQVLRENPTIEVMIDLHRDEVKEGTKLVTTLQGKDTAKFMFFNGLCYTNELGELTSLPNEYIQENLAFTFQMQLAAQEYYPGLTRRIYLKGYRYNLHYRPKSLLIELGAQTNTVEEAMNACKPLAHLIAMVLNGEAEQ